MQEYAVTGILKNWSRAGTDDLHIYWGNLYGDTKGRWADGTYIHTSKVTHTEEMEDHFIVHTLNSVYLLPKAEQHKTVSQIKRTS